MIVDYGPGRPPKHRVSHQGVVEPIGIPIGQEVSITLKFQRRRAGEALAVSALDQGFIDVQQPVTTPEDGAVTFQFIAAITPGLCRVHVYGAQTYELRLYAFGSYELAVVTLPL